MAQKETVRATAIAQTSPAISLSRGSGHRGQSRDGLSFTERDEGGRLVNWHPGTPAKYWEVGQGRGSAFFDEVRMLATVSAEDAIAAVRYAITAPSWGSRVIRGYGEEDGFADCIARAAVAHLCGGGIGRRKPK